MKKMFAIALALGATAALAATALAQDVCAPAATTNLAAASYNSSIRLTWTPSGDDCATGTASRWEVRYSSTSITDTNWQGATVLISGDSSDNGCAVYSHACPGTQSFYFVVFQFDEANNRSPISNCVLGSTRCGPPYQIAECP